MTTPVRSGPPATTVAPTIVPSVAGLTSLARFPTDVDERWFAGYAYRTEFPARARLRSQNTTTLGTNVIVNRGPVLIDTIPVVLSVDDHVSSFSWNVEDLPKRVERILEAYTSRLLERELWTGEIAVTDNLPNRVLAIDDANDVTPTTLPSSRDAVGILTNALSDAGVGDVMIHATKRAAIQLPDAWRNEETLEMFGFTVVSGAGYPGTGPDGTGTNWMYATDVVNVHLGPIEVVPDELSEAIRRSDNTITYYAQRFAAADFAGPVFACQVSET